MAALFGELASSSSIEMIDLSHNSHNQLSINGFRCMVPFLKSTRLMHIDLMSCDFFNDECFELLIHALNEKPIKKLTLYSCHITNISALMTNTLPQLEDLSLGGNHIGNAGIMILSKMLQVKGSILKRLSLPEVGIDDKGAEVLADSLKQNTTLKTISLNYNNGMTEIGCLAFLKLVNDVSSIDNTYNSNHTLERCDLNIYLDLTTLQMSYKNSGVVSEIKNLVEGACRLNSEVPNRYFFASRNVEAIGRAKVIKYQLHSQRMETLCRCQGIRYSPGSIFADIEPVLLPKILALIGNEHGQSELYTALIHTAPDLLSYIDRKALIRNALAKVEANFISLSNEYEHAVTWYLNHLSSISAQRVDLSSQLALIDLGDEAEKKAALQRASSLPPLFEDATDANEQYTASRPVARVGTSNHYGRYHNQVMQVKKNHQELIAHEQIVRQQVDQLQRTQPNPALLDVSLASQLPNPNQKPNINLPDGWSYGWSRGQ